MQQTHQAALYHRLNLAGSGVVAWDARSELPELPFTYRATQLAIYIGWLLHRTVGGIVPMVPEGLVLLTSVAFAIGVTLEQAELRRWLLGSPKP